MSFNWVIIREKLYGILAAPGRGMVKIVQYDEKGNETISPVEANRFFVTFKSNDPNLDSYTVLVAIRDEGQKSYIEIKNPELQNDKDFKTVFDMISLIRSGIGKREGIKVNWRDFDREIDPREEAVNNIKESKDVSKIFGTTKSSFQRIGEAKLIIRHLDTVNEEKHGARTRHIKALFVENKLGERFAYPHLHIAGARAFARHISNGGTNHDQIAQKICSLSEDYLSLRQSGKALRLQESARSYVLSIRECMNGINRKLKSMHGPKGYAMASQDLLSESSIIDTNAISELHLKLAECCGCDQEHALYPALGRAAHYIAGMPKMTEPMVFTWHKRPDMTNAVHPSAAERMYHQIMELARSCSNPGLSSRLSEIAEMISTGFQPNEEDLGLVKEAFASGMKFVSETEVIPEEQDLDSFFSSFSPEMIFSEDAEQDQVKDLEASGMDPDDAEQQAHDDIVGESDEDIAVEQEDGEILEDAGVDISRIAKLAGI